MSITPGKLLLGLAGITLPIGGFMADFFSETHMFNPRWPPHAKFHTGQTLSMSLLLGFSTLYYTFVGVGAAVADTTTRRALELQRLNFATLLAATYWITQAAASQYPGTLCVDPEFGEGCPQHYLDFGYLSVIAAGFYLERNRIVAAYDTKKVQ